MKPVSSIIYSLVQSELQNMFLKSNHKTNFFCEYGNLSTNKSLCKYILKHTPICNCLINFGDNNLLTLKGTLMQTWKSCNNSEYGHFLRSVRRHIKIVSQRLCIITLFTFWDMPTLDRPNLRLYRSNRIR